MKARNLAILALSGALAAAGQAGQSKAADYIRVQRWGLLGAGETTTVTHTELGVVYTPQRILVRDACGNCRVDVGMTANYAEVITGQCRTSHVDWDRSLLAVPGKILSGIGNALTPRPRICHEGYLPMYIAPVAPVVVRPGCCVPSQMHPPVSYGPYTPAGGYPPQGYPPQGAYPQGAVPQAGQPTLAPPQAAPPASHIPPPAPVPVY